MISVEPSVLRYASVLPGTGKTYYAVKRLVRLTSSKQTSIYAAPTVALLIEVERLLISNGVDPARIQRIVSEGDSVSVVDRMRSLIDGGSSPVTDFLTKRAKSGTIFLCTHEAFLRFPRFEQREHVHVIFDEARKCSIEEVSVTLHINAARYLADALGLTIGNHESYQLIKRVHYNAKEFDHMFSSTAQLRAVRSRVRSMLEGIKTNNTELWVRASFASASEESSEYKLHWMVDPASMLYGWKTCILLSAFMETTQLFHLLSRSNPTQRPGETRKAWALRVAMIDHPIILEDVSDQVVNRRRVERIKARLSATTITYVMPDTLFSKRKLQRGVMISPNVSTVRLQNALAERRERTGKKVTVADFIRAYNSKNRPTFSREDQAILDLMWAVGIISDTPIQHLVKSAVTMSQRWNAKHGYKPVPLPITLNVGSRRSTDHKGAYELEVEKVVDRKLVDVMPFRSQGRNKWANNNVIAFLATLNPKPALVSLMHYLAPQYDPKIDSVIDQAVQSLMRGATRNVYSDSRPLIIVTDQELAYDLQKHLLGLPRIVDPEKFKIDLKIPWVHSLDTTVYKSNDDVKIKVNARSRYLYTDPVWAKLVKMRTLRTSLVRRKADKLTIQNLENDIKVYNSQHKEHFRLLRMEFNKLWAAGHFKDESS